MPAGINLGPHSRNIWTNQKPIRYTCILTWCQQNLTHHILQSVVRCEILLTGEQGPEAVRESYAGRHKTCTQYYMGLMDQHTKTFIGLALRVCWDMCATLIIYLLHQRYTGYIWERKTKRRKYISVYMY